MVPAQQKKAFTEALICTIGCIVLSWFIRYPFPFNIFAFASLAVSGFVMSTQLHSAASIKTIFPVGSLSKKLLLFCIIGLEVGFILALYSRVSYGMTILPHSVERFVVIAIAIAITEELVFRGFIQARLTTINSTLGIAGSALSHAAYKSALFLSPAAEQRLDVFHFFCYSLAAFLCLGVLKKYSNSILPPILAHLVFDIVVYAACVKAPWWVW